MIWDTLRSRDLRRRKRKIIKMCRSMGGFSDGHFGSH